MLWDIIRDFIVQYITGGCDSDLEVHSGLVGLTAGNNDLYTDSFYFHLGGSGSIDYYISLGDWLATTLTIICMCLIVIFAIWLVRWIFKAVSSAFLLRR